MPPGLKQVARDEFDEARMAAMRMVGTQDDRTTILTALLRAEQLLGQVPETPVVEPADPNNADEGESD